MKKNRYVLFGLLVLLTSMASCIHDDTTGFEKEISEITISKIQGENITESGAAYVDLLMPMKMEPVVEQSLEGYELSYEWKAGLITKEENGQVEYDSLSLLSEERVLDYAFKKVGTYWLRLRVYNEFGSTFHYMKVFVRAGMEEGLCVLSEDAAGKGRISFLKTRGEEELLAKEAKDVDTEVWSRINYDYDLVSLQDMIVSSNDASTSVFLATKDQPAVYQLDNNTLEVLQRLPISLLVDWVKPVSLCMLESSVCVLSDNGRLTTLTQQGMAMERIVEENTDYRFVKMMPYTVKYDNSSLVICVDINKEKIAYLGAMMGDGSLDCTDQEIVNCGGASDGCLYVVAIAKNDPLKVKITSYREDVNEWWGMLGFTSPVVVSEYEATSPLTLTLNTDFLENKLYKVFFYYNGNKIYRWRYSVADKPLPTDADTENVCRIPSGEITCMSQSTDGKYLYVGVYDEGASSELKGSVYVYDADTWEMKKSFVGIADKPIKVMYKNS